MPVLQLEFLSILAWYKTSAAQQSVVAVVWFSSSWCSIHTLGDKSGMEAGQSSTRTKPRFCRPWQMRPWHCPTEISTYVLGRDSMSHMLMAMYVSLKSHYASALLRTRRSLFLTNFGTKGWATTPPYLQRLSLWWMLKL